MATHFAEFGMKQETHDSGCTTTQNSSNESSMISEKSLVEDPPDGGYGWVVVGCCFLINAVTWGCNSAFGVFLSFYRKNNYFPGATDTEFAFIGSTCIAFGLLVSPLANYLSKTYHFKVSMLFGTIFVVLSNVLAGFSQRIWQLFLTQGVMFGIGLGLTFIPSIPLVNQWFGKKRARAAGIVAAGGGAGGLVISLTTRVIIEKLGLRWAFFINGLLSFTFLVPALILIKGRSHIINAKFEPIQYQYLWHPGLAYVFSWTFFSLLGYIIALYTVPTYSTSGLGLSQTQGANLQSILTAGQMIGRPLCGLLMDRFGRINMASLISFISGVSILAIWLPGRTYGVLIFFAIIQGLVGGVMWVAAAPVVAEIIGLADLGSALGILWLSLVIPALIAEPTAVWLLEYSRTQLHRSGANAFLISIGFSGACFIAGSIMLLGAKRWKQHSWQVIKKT